MPLEGAMGLTLQNARATLAKAVAFQSWVGASTPAEAESRIAKWQDLFKNYPRPYAILAWMPGARKAWSSEGTQPEFHPWVVGTIKARFVAELEKGQKDPSQAFEDFLEAAELSMEGMKDLSGVDANLVMDSYSLSEDPGIFLKEDDNPFDGFAAEFMVEVGSGAG